MFGPSGPAYEGRSHSTLAGQATEKEPIAALVFVLEVETGRSEVHVVAIGRRVGGMRPVDAARTAIVQSTIAVTAEAATEKAKRRCLHNSISVS